MPSDVGVTCVCVKASVDVCVCVCFFFNHCAGHVVCLYAAESRARPACVCTNAYIYASTYLCIYMYVVYILHMWLHLSLCKLCVCVSHLDFCVNAVFLQRTLGHRAQLGREMRHSWG